MNSKNTGFSLLSLVKSCGYATADRVTYCSSAIYPPPYHRLNLNYTICYIMRCVFRGYTAGLCCAYIPTNQTLINIIYEKNLVSYNGCVATM